MQNTTIDTLREKITTMALKINAPEKMALDIKRKGLAEKGKPLQLIRQELKATLDDSWGHNLKEKYRL